MLTRVHPKLPMRNQSQTKRFYTELLGFELYEGGEYDGYLMLRKDAIEIHFFRHETLDITTNDGQIYLRTSDIHALYAAYIKQGVPIHPNGALSLKPWRQWEFSMLDPDHNLLTFGEE